MSGRIRRGLGRLRESLLGLRGMGRLLPAWGSVVGEAPAVTFPDLVAVYLGDPSAKAAVDFLADQAVGAGFYTTVNRRYAGAERAKAAVDEFNEAVNLDGLLQRGAREVVAFGNSLWERVTPQRLENLKVLPLTGVERILRDEYGRVRGYRQTASYGGKTLAPEAIIHFCWNPVDGEPFGTGILRVLLENLQFQGGEAREGLMKYKARIERVMPDIFEKYAGPDELWIFEGVDEARLADYQRLIRGKPKAGARFVYNKPADIKTVTIDPRTTFQAYVDHLTNQFYLGLQTPLPKLFTTPGFTEASARAAVEMAERKVLALQRFLKRIAEREIFVPVVVQAGLDPRQAGVRLNWGMPEALDMKTLVGTLPILVDSWKSGGITTQELRAILRDMLHLEQVAEHP